MWYKSQGGKSGSQSPYLRGTSKLAEKGRRVNSLMSSVTEVTDYSGSDKLCNVTGEYD